MKKLLLLSVLFIGLSGNAFAWVQADNQATICNKTKQTLHFFKTYSYQANTNNDHSADFIIERGKCVDVDYWLQYKANGHDADDDLEFTEQSGAGSFHIKAFIRGATLLSSSVMQFDMPNFYYVEHQDGGWGHGKIRNLVFSILDLCPNSGINPFKALSD
jgi:hypothetical protein